MTSFRTILYKNSMTIIAMLTFSLLLSDMAFANEANAQFVVGQVMVKFKEATEATQLLNKAKQSNPPNIKVLTPIIEQLSDKTGIPLTAQQLLSGDWILLSIDANKLTSLLEKQLRKRSSIADLQLIASESQNPEAMTGKNIDITFQADSLEYKTIKSKSGTDNNSVTELVRELSKALSVPLQGTADQRGHLILQLEPKAITVELSNRLQNLQTMIESVQLNYISTGMKQYDGTGLQ